MNSVSVLMILAPMIFLGATCLAQNETPESSDQSQEVTLEMKSPASSMTDVVNQLESVQPVAQPRSRSISSEQGTLVILAKDPNHVPNPIKMDPYISDDQVTFREDPAH